MTENTIVVETKTKEAYLNLMDVLEKEGYVWSSGTVPTRSDFLWDNHGRDTCVRIQSKEEGLTYCDREWYEELGYKIISFEEYMTKQFKKGDILVNEDKLYAVYIGEIEGVFVTSNTSIYPDTAKHLLEVDIFDAWSKAEWEGAGWKKYTEKVELTLEEIAEKFGVDVNNLKIKK